MLAVETKAFSFQKACDMCTSCKIPVLPSSVPSAFGRKDHS